ncbi:Gfo/Idh/MocA family protein [Pedobacter sp. MW01-1-1]|uniref:Gfo/Idh/MocA family protein n=1 Tax=Pedobacter sp. MW01-1-1 TaxID=3383027 RepID=UPI003FEEF4AC
MISSTLNRKDFIFKMSLLGISPFLSKLSFAQETRGKRVGIIGLDTSHSIAFTKLLNAVDADAVFDGYKVVAAYPYGSKDLALSKERIPKQMEEIQRYQVKICTSIAALLKEVDVVLLETNDGRLHLEQALEVIKAGKPLFIDKPLAASLKDGVSIFEASKKYNVPVFSASSLRFMNAVKKVRNGGYGKVLAADSYSPATIEPSHSDLFWYAIHGVEILFAVMGTGCKELTRYYQNNMEVVVGVWEDGRLGTFRGTRISTADFGGVCFTEKETIQLGPYLGYQPLLIEIVKFFNTGIPPVSPIETLEVLAFMEAAEISKNKNGARVSLQRISRHF